MEETIAWLFLAAIVGSMVWVYLDAPKHGLSRGWVVGLFLFWILAFPAYLIARSAKKKAPPQRHVQPAIGQSSPAWLPDPWFPGRFRYWDGERWTSNSSAQPK